MHRYLRAIGFRQLQKQPQVWNLLTKIQKQPDYMESMVIDEESTRETMAKEFAPCMGIAVNGLRYKGRFHREDYYPYLKGKKISSFAPCTVSRQGAKDAYVGLCEDPHFGSNIIFYLNNSVEVLGKHINLDEPLENRGISFSGLALNGKVLLPLHKTLSEKVAGKLHAESRAKIVEDARQGDEFSIGYLAEEEVSMYNAVAKHVMTDDLYTMIDTFFLPTGVECDQYTILGDILEVSTETNALSGEEIYVLGVLCNNVYFTVAINSNNLLGEPQAGRRFKGEIWLQGSLILEA